MTDPILEIKGLERRFDLPREGLFGKPRTVYALNGVDLTVKPGESFGIVGESGCGKTTLARIVMGLETPSAGSVKVLGKDVHATPADELRAMRGAFQMVFQDPYGALNPRHRVERIVAEPLYALGENPPRAERRKRVAETLVSVGLRAADMEKYPHEFSGGQRQRVAIARALITRPSLIVADEPVSALDVSVQAQVLNLLRDLEDEYGVTFVMISHNLAVVDYACRMAAVIYRGYIVERGTTAALFGDPQHPYTQSLVDAVPQLGVAPAPRMEMPATVQTSLGAGCPFTARCPYARERCGQERPALRDAGGGHHVACHFAGEVGRERAAAAGRA